MCYILQYNLKLKKIYLKSYNLFLFSKIQAHNVEQELTAVKFPVKTITGDKT